MKSLVEEKIQVGVLIYRLRRRSFGGILFFLAILSLIPGISIFSAIFMMILGIQLTLGFRVPTLPRFINEYCFKVDQLKSLLNKTVPKIEKVEKYIKPRLSILTLFPFTLILGLIIFCLAIIIMIPLPFTNLLPALSALVISFALLERDGVLIILGAITSVFSFVLGGLVTYLALQGIESVALVNFSSNLAVIHFDSN